jgi:Zn-dependent protease with chaperone function
VIFCIDWLTALPWRKASAAHWTDKARLLWPVRTATALNLLLVPVCLSIAEGAALQVTLQGMVVMAVAGLLGATLATAPLQRRIYPRFTFRSWLRLVSAQWTIRAGIWGVLGVSAVLMPEEPGIATAIIAAGVLLYILAWNFGLFMRVLRVIGALRPADQRLRGIVAERARRAGVREPVSWLLDVPLAQALAMPTTRELMFTSRLMEISSDEEISAVCAHELAHLTESKRVVGLRLVGTLTYYPLIFLQPAMHYGLLALASIFLWISLLAQANRNLSRRMETRADKFATEFQGDEGVYARALEKLYCDSLMPAVNSSNRRAHPNLYDRMLAAGIQPDYPRPAKPGRMAWTGYVIPLALGALIGVSLARK